MENFRFMIIGAGRGGTSLLTSCMNAHSMIDMAFEAFSHELMGLNMAHTEYGRIFDERAGRFKSLCLDEARRHLPSFWGNKITTEHLFGLEDHNAMNPPCVDLVERLFTEVLPGVLVVFIIRDGRACISSKVNRTGQPWMLAAFRWRYCIQAFRFFKEKYPLALTVRFEDLVTEPERELRRVCSFIDVPFERAMLHNTQDVLMPAEYKQPGFVREKAVAPDLPGELFQYIKSDLAYCGYI